MTEVTRESLAAALQRIHDDPRPYDEIGFDFAALSYEAAADAILAALPEAAVQEPYRVATCPHCGEDLSIWRAAQPAPDLDVEVLARALHAAVPHWARHKTIFDDHRSGHMEDATELAAEYTRLLQARESGGEP